jgi:NAD(P)-dependent dehydrogenase (short-subunit alcohol dehydrogenase family)
VSGYQSHSGRGRVFQPGRLGGRPIGAPATPAKVVEAALVRFGSINVLVNNAGIFFTRPFTDYTAEDFRSLVSTNLDPLTLSFSVARRCATCSFRGRSGRRRSASCGPRTRM